ncbi:hypothetical protein EW146_g8960 [Bondarzewia mesenterica]|uniref:F-box domain-containing protein n=1 Tax=Bondarzewia mesenterica TaxID=1095465 RepID=A0A4S4LA10_9AGAM|nr:hypothetical protein EW146_g8960 [Bondarzewia mesenterica]
MDDADAAAAHTGFASPILLDAMDGTYSESTATLDDDPEDALPGMLPALQRRRATNPFASPVPKPPVKRGRKADAKPKGPSRRLRGRLHRLPAMPLDILYDIFCFLTPHDLINLARTSKSLHILLLSRNAAFVWRITRINAPGPTVPYPPSDFSEKFDDHPILDDISIAVSKGLRRSIGFVADASALVRERDLATSEIKILGASATDLVPHSVTERTRHDYRTYKIFWKPDVNAMDATMKQFAADIQAGKTGAQEAWEEFRKQRIEHIEEVTKDLPRFRLWSMQLAATKMSETKRKREVRFQAIRTRLLSLGHCDDDIQSFRFRRLSEVNSSKELTVRNWQRIQETLEAFLIELTTKRIEEQERREAFRLKSQPSCAAHGHACPFGITTCPQHLQVGFARRARIVPQERTAKAQRLYAEYLTRVLPAQWPYLPAAQHAAELTNFQLIITASAHSPLSDSAWDVAVADIPRAVSVWMTSRRDRFIGMLPSDLRQRCPPMVPSLLSTRTLDAGDTDAPVPVTAEGFAGPLELAVAVFTDGAYAYIGSDLCNVWKARGKNFLVCNDFGFSMRGARAAACLVMAAGLEVKQTTVRMMDKLDLRFVCVVCCEAAAAPGGDGIARVYGWRNCVEHFMHERFQTHASPQFCLLIPDFAERIRVLEPYDASIDAPRWHCNRCTGPPGLSDRRTVLAHVRAEHKPRKKMNDDDHFDDDSHDNSDDGADDDDDDDDDEEIEEEDDGRGNNNDDDDGDYLLYVPTPASRRTLRWPAEIPVGEIQFQHVDAPPVTAPALAPALAPISQPAIPPFFQPVAPATFGEDVTLLFDASAAAYFDPTQPNIFDPDRPTILDPSAYAFFEPGARALIESAATAYSDPAFRTPYDPDAGGHLRLPNLGPSQYSEMNGGSYVETYAEMAPETNDEVKQEMKNDEDESMVKPKLEDDEPMLQPKREREMENVDGDGFVDNVDAPMADAFP